MAESPYLTVDEAAAYARVHQKTIRRWMTDDGLPFTKARPSRQSRVRIKLADLQQFLDRHYTG